MPIEKLRPSFNLDEERLTQLQAVVPEAFADGHINWDVLREALGEHLEEENQEHFGLSWPGKREARRLASQPSKGTLIPQPGQGVNEDETHNIFIEGDNLEVLKLLQKSYAGRIKLIYIDPPYNTGGDKIYHDDFSEPLEGYLREIGSTDEGGKLLTTNSRADGRFHSTWLSMMYPRLRLARDLLAEDGVIFASIDDNESHNLHQIMNELYGEENFVANITAISNLKGRNDKAHIATAHERLLVFKKPAFQEVGFRLTEAQRKEYNLINENGESYRLLGLRKRGGADTRAVRPNLFFPIYVNPSSGRISIDPSSEFSVEVLPRKSDGTDGAWRWDRRKVARDSDSLIGTKKQTGEWDVFQIDYLFRSGSERTTKPKSVWFGSDISTDSATKEFKKLMGDIGFDNPKPVPLLRDIIQYSTRDGDIILDFFSGSSTTAHAVIELNASEEANRNFIMIQLPEVTAVDSKARLAGYKTLAEIGRERIRRAISTVTRRTKGQLSFKAGKDLGFRCYRLERTNIKEWQAVQEVDIDQLEIRFQQAETPLVDDWQTDDLLTEIMLMQGFPLDSRMRPLPEFHDNHVLEVSSECCQHHLYACLDESIQAETVASIRLRPEDVFVCLDSALTDQAKIALADRCNLKVI